MRRHTGETPFVCSDCPVRFKTRNTYKRHLKTRHGKLLTATGIQRLSTEEFKRFQTKPYRKRVTQDLINHLVEAGKLEDTNDTIPPPAKKITSVKDGRSKSEKKANKGQKPVSLLASGKITPSASSTTTAPRPATSNVGQMTIMNAPISSVHPLQTSQSMAIQPGKILVASAGSTGTQLTTNTIPNQGQPGTLLLLSGQSGMTFFQPGAQMTSVQSGTSLLPDSSKAVTSTTQSLANLQSGTILLTGGQTGTTFVVGGQPLTILPQQLVNQTGGPQVVVGQAPAGSGQIHAPLTQILTQQARLPAPPQQQMVVPVPAQHVVPAATQTLGVDASVSTPTTTQAYTLVTMSNSQKRATNHPSAAITPTTSVAAKYTDDSLNTIILTAIPGLGNQTLTPLDPIDSTALNQTPVTQIGENTVLRVL